MIARVLLAVLLCGIAGGFLMGVMQHVRLTPIILAAEKFEVSEAAHSHAGGTPAEHHHDDTAWAPSDGWERTAFTFAASILTGVGFAAILAGLAIVGNRPITWRNGLLWGLGGFFAVSFAPALTLPPELPGMAEKAVQDRQLSWVVTILLTALALWILTAGKNLKAISPAFLVFLFPLTYGASEVATSTSTVPASLAAQFVTASLGANLVMWCSIGLSLGYVFERFKLNVD